MNFIISSSSLYYVYAQTGYHTLTEAMARGCLFMHIRACCTSITSMEQTGVYVTQRCCGIGLRPPKLDRRCPSTSTTSRSIIHPFVRIICAQRERDCSLIMLMLFSTSRTHSLFWAEFDCIVDPLSLARPRRRYIGVAVEKWPKLVSHPVAIFNNMRVALLKRNNKTHPRYTNLFLKQSAYGK